MEVRVDGAQGDLSVAALEELEGAIALETWPELEPLEMSVVATNVSSNRASAHRPPDRVGFP